MMNNSNYHMFQSSVTLSAFAFILTGLSAGAQAAFSSDFESPEFIPGILQSDPDWSFDATQLAVSVDDTSAASGLQSLSLSGTGLFAYETDPVVLLPDVMWLDFYFKPVFSPEEGLPLSFSSDRTAVAGFVHLGSEGEVYVVDGDGQGGGQWLSTGSTLALTGNVAQDWVRFTYRLDYASKTWDLYVDNQVIAVDLHFLNTQAARFDEFALSGGEEGDASFDAFTSQPANPLFLDTSNDGLPDTWLQQQGLDVVTNQRYGDPDADGLDNIYEYLLENRCQFCGFG